VRSQLFSLRRAYLFAVGAWSSSHPEVVPVKRLVEDVEIGPISPRVPGCSRRAGFQHRRMEALDLEVTESLGVDVAEGDLT
jgi:hypothetical protein